MIAYVCVALILIPEPVLILVETDRSYSIIFRVKRLKEKSGITENLPYPSSSFSCFIVVLFS